jgi:hypothetical protein
MRLSLVLVLVLPSLATAQTEEVIRALERKLDTARTAKWMLEQEDPKGGFYLAPQDPKLDAKPQPVLRATSGAVRALKYSGHTLLPKERERHAAFVLSCYDAKTGAFAEPGGKPDVAITSVGVMAATELGIPKEKFAKAMDYLKANAKTFEEVRIAAAAVEAWGAKDCPFKLDDWFAVARKHVEPLVALKELEALGEEKLVASARDGLARELGSVAAFHLRLGKPVFGAPALIGGPKPNPPIPGFIDIKITDEKVAFALIEAGQRDDGGWGKKGEKASDIETTYRVMRALHLQKAKPKDTKLLREFVAKHRNEDHGYATKPGDKSSMSGVYYCTVVLHWLDEMEKP